ncbi:efflux transporter [Hysterangium stoloniferum]|nr:efflux transporter [Hysterangium stoloniferum]
MPCCVQAISSSAVNISLADIGRQLHIEQDRLQWTTSAYALSGGCFLLLFGRLADIYGRKKVFLLGTAWSAIFALGCGFTRSMVQITILRGCQGIGSAAAIPAAVGILAHSFPPGMRRSIGFAIFSAGNPFGAGLGLALGSIVTEFSDVQWRGAFFVVSGCGALSFITAALVIDRDVPTTEKDARVDWIGAVLVTSGLVLVTFVLGQGPLAPNGFRTSYIIALLIVGVFMILSFLGWEHYLVQRTTMPPLMRLELWKRGNGKFSAIQGIAFLGMCAFVSWNLWAQLYYQTYQDYTPVRTMVRFVPMIVAGFILNVVVGILVGLVDVLWILVAGTLSTGSACLLFALIDPNAVYWAFGFPASILAVVGADFIFAVGSLFVAHVALPHEQSVAGGVFQAIGVSFGLAVTTLVHNEVFTREAARDGVAPSSDGNDASPAALTAFKAAQWTGVGFAMAAMLLAVVFLRGIGVIGNRGPPQQKVPATPTRTSSIDEEEKSSVQDIDSQRTDDDDDKVVEEEDHHHHVLP